MSETRLIEPTFIKQGDRIAWTRTFDDYPATEWSLKYLYRGGGQGFDVTATSAGKDFTCEITAAQSAAASVAKYAWQARLTNIATPTNTFSIIAGDLNIERGFVAGTVAAVDLRTPAKIALDYINAAISGQADEKVLRYEIATPSGTRRVERMTMADLLAAQKHYTAIVANENARARVRQGGPFMQSIGVKFYD